MKLSDRARAILRSKTFAHVAAIDAAGKPHVTPVWVDVDDKDTIWINTARGRVKDRLLGLDAPTALAAVDPENPYEYVQVRGHDPTGKSVIDSNRLKYPGDQFFLKTAAKMA